MTGPFHPLSTRTRGHVDHESEASAGKDCDAAGDEDEVRGDAAGTGDHHRAGQVGEVGREELTGSRLD